MAIIKKLKNDVLRLVDEHEKLIESEDYKTALVVEKNIQAIQKIAKDANVDEEFSDFLTKESIGE